jgi:single-stranded-DNA-specific exonuclease
VALGTIADLVPLTGENRILVTAGLERLNATQRPGLVALKSVASTNPGGGQL